jgi:hypothetical protein
MLNVENSVSTGHMVRYFIVMNMQETTSQT